MESPPDFRKALDGGRIIWIDAFRRKTLVGFFDHFMPDEDGRIKPKPNHEIEKILRKFVKTTCQTIRRKRKKSVPINDTFINVVLIVDRYESQSLNYQALANSLPKNDVIVTIFFEFWGADRIAKKNVHIYYNEHNELDQPDLDYINQLVA